MNDSELLKLAAKASGVLHESWYENDSYWAGLLSNWNPLEDDGDALRLAVKLELDIYNSCISVRAIHRDRNTGASVKCRGNNPQMDPYSATRRAIVRAAAEIGRNMK